MILNIWVCRYFVRCFLSLICVFLIYSFSSCSWKYPTYGSCIFPLSDVGKQQHSKEQWNWDLAVYLHSSSPFLNSLNLWNRKSEICDALKSHRNIVFLLPLFWGGDGVGVCVYSTCVYFLLSPSGICLSTSLASCSVSRVL